MRHYYEKIFLKRMDNIMKKKNLLISALLVCFLSSCGGTSETPTPQPSENDPTTDVSESTSTPVSELVSQNQFAQELAFLTDSFVISLVKYTLLFILSPHYYFNIILDYYKLKSHLF